MCKWNKGEEETGTIERERSHTQQVVIEKKKSKAFDGATKWLPIGFKFQGLSFGANMCSLLDVLLRLFEFFLFI